MGWMWLADELQSLDVDVHLAHQKKAKAISEARLKTDSVDAETLRQLLWTGFLPEAFLPPPKVRDQRMLLGYRMALVHLKVRLLSVGLTVPLAGPAEDLHLQAGAPCRADQKERAAQVLCPKRLDAFMALQVRR